MSDSQVVENAPVEESGIVVEDGESQEMQESADESVEETEDGGSEQGSENQEQNEALTIEIAGESLVVEYNKAGRIANQASACNSIIAFDAVEEAQQALRKGLKQASFLNDLDVDPEGHLNTITRRLTERATQMDGLHGALTGVMRGSNGFTVPQGGGTTTPANVIMSSKDLRRAAVAGARATLTALASNQK